LLDAFAAMRILPLILVALLAGCRAFVPVADIDALPPSARNTVRALPVYDETQFASRDFEILGVVEGISCKHWLWDPSASREAALEQAQYFAWDLGADGLANVEFGGKEGTSLHTNCWEVIRCSAKAIKFKAPQRPT